jgi:hypothetical protein
MERVRHCCTTPDDTYPSLPASVTIIRMTIVATCLRETVRVDLSARDGTRGTPPLVSGFFRESGGRTLNRSTAIVILVAR